MVMLTSPIESKENLASVSNLVEINFIKHDFIDTKDVVKWHIYAKDIESTSLNINFNQKHVIIKFKSQDNNFIQYYPQSNENTIFQWKVELADFIEPYSSSYKLSKVKLEINLCKQKPGVKWNCVFLNDNDMARPKPAPNIIGTSVEKPKEEEIAKESFLRKDPSYGYNQKLNSDFFNKNDMSKPKQGSNYFDQQSIEEEEKKIEESSVEKGSFYGYTGLVNIGNTCYINATLQCLFNTTDLVKFFADTNFQNEINRTNPLGLEGILATQFALLVRQIWSGNHKQISPTRIRELICRKYSQFKGFSQQDAQEFLVSILSLLHEDLNRIEKRPVLEPLESDGWTDEEIAHESWKRFLSRDDSIIVDNFFGQYKSKLTCPECHKISIIFEPFNSILVPLPGSRQQLECIVVLKSFDSFKFIANVISNGSFNDIINQIRIELNNNFNSSSFKILLVSNGVIKETYSVECSLDVLKDINLDDHTVVINEICKKDEPSVELHIKEIKCKTSLIYSNNCANCRAEPNPGQSLKRCGKCFSVAYCNTECQSLNWNSHKQICDPKEYSQICLPFLVSIGKSGLSEKFLTSSLIKNFKNFIKLKHMVNDELMKNQTILDSYFVKIFEFETNKKKLASISKLYEYINHEIETNVNNNVQINVTVNLKAIPNIHIVDLKLNNLKKIHSDITNNILNYTLDDCLKLFTQPEKLNEQNPWYCSKCKKHQEATKQINLWKLPNYLVIILKRFQAQKEDSSAYPDWVKSQYGYFFDNSVRYQKLNTFIEFPLSNLNMSSYVIDPKTQNSDDNIYDLYGVINHLGDSLHGGHYTSYSRFYDPNDLFTSLIDWRLFDDSRVYDVRSDQVVTQDAYVLFYRRRKTSSSSLITSSLNVDVESSDDKSSSSSVSQSLSLSSSTVSEYFETENDANAVFTDLNDID